MLPKLLQGGLLVVLLIILWIGFRWLTAPLLWRQTTAIVAPDMVHVVSWDANLSHIVVLDIPKTTVISGTRGYGNYTVQSLFALDAIDKHGGRVFLESLSDALGLPITGFVSAPDLSGAGSLEMLRDTYTWSSLLSKNTRHFVPWKLWAAQVFAMRGFKADEAVFFSAQQALVDATQPDGSVISVLDPQRLDYMYGTEFIDTVLRTEEVSVAVYNTTQVPTIGQRAARILTQSGVSVITVSNDDMDLDRCQVSGSKEKLRSVTAKFMTAYFGCTNKEEALVQADVALKLGKAYAAMFEGK
jgi:hypothetical protein